MILSKEDLWLVAHFEELTVLCNYGTKEGIEMLNRVTKSEVDQHGCTLYFANPTDAEALYDAIEEAGFAQEREMEES